MVSVDEAKARRRAGVAAMTTAQKIRRDLTGGRPPVGELKTPLAAVTAARVLQSELEARLSLASVEPEQGECGVSIAYVSPDLRVLGFTRLFAPGEESAITAALVDQITLGLIFAIVDKEADQTGRTILTGARPFFVTKQTEAWLSELLTPVRFALEDVRSNTGE